MSLFTSPVAQIKIQRRFRAPLKANAASVFRSDKVYFEAEVAYAIRDGQGVGTLQADLYNIPTEEIRKLEPGGLIQVLGGYADPEAEAEDLGLGSIFYGSLVHAYQFRSGANRILRISATNTPVRFGRAFVPLSAKEITAGEALEILFDRVGGSVLLPDSAYTVVMSNYTAKNAALREAMGIVQEMGAILKRPIMGPAPVPHMPYSYYVLDPAFPGLKEISIDTALDSVYNTTVTPVQGVPLGAAQLDGVETSPEALESDSGYLEFSMNAAFDPRFVPGVICRVSEPEVGEGKFATTNLVHRVGGAKWGTEASGPFQGEDWKL